MNRIDGDDRPGDRDDAVEGVLDTAASDNAEVIGGTAMVLGLVWRAKAINWWWLKD